MKENYRMLRKFGKYIAFGSLCLATGGMGLAYFGAYSGIDIALTGVVGTMTGVYCREKANEKELRYDRLSSLEGRL